MVLYRKYRPQRLSEVVGQEHITTTLKNALRMGRVSHAYLFSGPRGTGKTSVARILAKAVNCEQKRVHLVQKKGKDRQIRERASSSALPDSSSELTQRDAHIRKNGMGESFEPCNRCGSCTAITNGTHLDLWEIDAASNRGIDDVRELREKVHFRPSLGDKKVYILDEVHMLTTEAFNALLKTLEEPPEHSLFILCTTEAHKVPTTIVSRCQRFDFALADGRELCQYLRGVTEKERMNLSEGALELLSENALGSYRDVLSLLEQVVSHFQGEKVDSMKVRKVLGLPDELQIKTLINFINQNRVDEVINFIDRLYRSGCNIHELTRGFIRYLRKEMLIRFSRVQTSRDSQVIELKSEEILNLITRLVRAESEIKYAAIPQLPLELQLIEFMMDKDGGALVQDKNSQNPSGPSVERSPREFPERTWPGTSQSNSRDQRDKTPGSFVSEFWPRVLAGVRPYNHTLEALLKSGRPSQFKDGVLTLEFTYPFHKERVEQGRNRELVERVIGELLGEKVRLRCVLGERRA